MQFTLCSCYPRREKGEVEDGAKKKRMGPKGREEIRGRRELECVDWGKAVWDFGR